MHLFQSPEEKEKKQKQYLKDVRTVNISHVQEAIQTACAVYTGDFHILQAALGALMMGQFYGWRVLRIVISRRAYKRYEGLLGIEFKEVCPEYGVLSKKSLGLKIAEGLGKFWFVVKGSVRIKNKKQITD